MAMQPEGQLTKEQGPLSKILNQRKIPPLPSALMYGNGLSCNLTRVTGFQIF